MKFYYTCSECSKQYDISPDLMVCPECSSNQRDNQPLNGILNVTFEGTLPVTDEYFPLLPIEEKYFPDIPVGKTPCFRSDSLSRLNGLNSVFIKNDSLNPTGSYKDRASLLVAAMAKKFNINQISVASTGNAASSMAGIGANAGLEITIFVPENAPPAKIIQSLQYGANVFKVKGNYDRAYEISMEYAEKTICINRNTAFNPMTIEGKKTASFEIFNSLGKVPDHIFVPVGDGVILSGIYKGFEDMLKLGWTKSIPVIHCVQSEKSSAIHDAFNRGSFIPVQADTVADSIAVDVPRNGFHALGYLKKYNGKTVIVSDMDILNAQKELSETTGIFAEPAAAAAYSGFIKNRKYINSEHTVVIMITGNGLKDISAASRIIEIPAKTISSLRDMYK